ncbi:MAG: hypothetical protein R3F61_29120 [Myxococcota bacterium]
MLSSLLLLSLTARAECPPLEPKLDDAQRDTLSFFLSDAQASLASAETSFGCASVEPAVLARYWLIQAMIWHLQEQEGRADAALAAAKVADGNTFVSDLGDELRALWESAEVPVAETVRVRVRGMKKSDGLRVDTREMPEVVVVPGLHLVQVVRDGTVVFGRVADVPAAGMELVLAEGPEPETPAVTGSIALPAVAGPLQMKGSRVLDGAGSKVSFNDAVLPLSIVSAGGVDSWAERRRNGRLQRVALGTTAVGGWVTYLFSWDLLVGENLPPGRAAGLAAGGLAVAGTGLVWESVLLAKRRANRKRTVELANLALGAP